MSEYFEEPKRAKRIRKTQKAVDRQVKIAKDHGIPIEEPHKFHKHRATDCGQPACVMCGNPRKIWKQKTMQEKKFEESTDHELIDKTRRVCYDV